MKVLVTGAAGFLGPHVIAHLKGSGYWVVAHDIRPSTSVQADQTVQGDLTDFDHLVDVFQGIDAVCHLGGVGDVYLALDKPHLAASANVLGTATVAEAAVKAGVRKIVYASTWEVYGRPESSPIDESHPCRPEHPYSITKLAGEQLALAYGRRGRIQVTALRLGTAYGPGMRQNSVFSVFAHRAMRGLPLEIHGTGRQSRQFTHVLEISSAFCKALEKEFQHEVFNIVASRSVTIRELAEMVASVWPTQIVFREAREADAIPALVSSEKAANLLDWHPFVTFEEGLADLLRSIGPDAEASSSPESC